LLGNLYLGENSSEHSNENSDVDIIEEEHELEKGKRKY
jgi:hypothetical protein